jgi:V/A-type H+-transporting ATPase subunit D
MPDQLDVSPTQGNLLQLQDKLERVRSGRDLLDRKREVLVQELMSTLDRAEAVEEKAREQFRAAHDAIRQARMRMGTDQVRWISLAPTAEVETEVRTRSIMGARVPVVRINAELRSLPYGPGGTSAALDEARERWLDLLHLLEEMIETLTTVWRLAMELRKTQRRVNALESRIIPQYQHTVDYIEQVLAEENREDIVRAKKVKQMHQEE